MNPGWWSGHLPNPEAYNYTHYPLPMLWVYTFVYWLAGGWGVMFLVLALKLVGCILVFKILDHHFQRFAAWFATVLFAIAPCSIILDCETDLVATGALLWPAAAWFLLMKKRPNGVSAVPSWLAFMLTFVGGQISWFTLTLVPALMVMAAPPATSLRQTIAESLRDRVARALLFGALASFGFFLLQVVLYEPDFLTLIQHLRLKMGGEQSSRISRLSLFTLLPLRTVIFAGLALIAGGVSGLLLSHTNRKTLRTVAIVYLPSFLLAAIVIPHYFYMENIVYGSLLFPLAVLTAAVLEKQYRWLVLLLTVLALPGVAYTHLGFSVPTISATSRLIGRFMADHTAATDVIVTNVEMGHPPYKPSDVQAGKATSIIADRLVFYGVQSSEKLEQLPELLKRSDYNLIFIRSPGLPLSPDVSKRLEQDGQRLAVETLKLPTSELTLAERLRAYFWHEVMHKGKRLAPNSLSDSTTITFEVYRLPPVPLRLSP